MWIKHIFEEHNVVATPYIEIDVRNELILCIRKIK